MLTQWRDNGFYQAHVEIRETLEPGSSVRVDLEIDLGPQVAVEVKGATYTELEVRRLRDGCWRARCVVDV